MYDDILIPTDGSEAVGDAVDHALELAGTYDATVHVLYAITPLYAPETGFEQVYSAMEEEGEAAVDEIARRASAAGVSTETAVVRGTAHRQILDYVDDAGIDLVVMGTHGRTGLDRYLVGSVTEKVVRLSEVPVLTVRHDPDRADDGDEEADTPD